MARTQQAAQANITLQEQIEAIHKAKGLVPEEDGKDKIGPSKPNEINQPHTSSSTMSSSAPPMNSAPRPPPPVSLHQQMNPPVSRPLSVSTMYSVIESPEPPTFFDYSKVSAPTY